MFYCLTSVKKNTLFCSYISSANFTCVFLLEIMLVNKGEQDKCDTSPNWASILMGDTDKIINIILTVYDLLKCYEVKRENLGQYWYFR